MTFHSKASQCHNSTTTFLRSLGKFIAAVFLHNDGDDDDAMSEFPTFLKNAQKTDREKLSALKKDFRDNLSSAPNTKNPQTFFLLESAVAFGAQKQERKRGVVASDALAGLGEDISDSHCGASVRPFFSGNRREKAHSKCTSTKQSAPTTVHHFLLFPELFFRGKLHTHARATP